jgi:pimeloyl-ACP methyl ester carboxylesterase
MSIESPRRLTLPIDNRWGGGDMALLDFGAADRPVDMVFAHANGFNALTYRELLAPLATTYRILAPDLRGHGHTQLPINTDGRFDWADYADDLSAVLDSLDGPPVVLAGHSMGAVTALLAAVQRPERVRGLVLLEPVIWPRALATVFGLPLIRRLPSQSPIAKGSRRRRARFDSRAAAMDAYRGRGAFKNWPDAMLADYLEDGLVDDGDGMVLACDPEWEASNYSAQSHNPWRALKRVGAPVHVLKGDEGTTCMLNEGQIEGVRVEIVPGGTHFLPMLRPEITRAALKKAMDGEAGPDVWR